MSPFECQALSRDEVTPQLAAAEMASSQAVSGATLYNLMQHGRECLLLAFPGGEGLRIELAKPPVRRRRADPGKPNPAA